MRWGKSSRGNPPKRRTVMLVPEMEWVVPVLQQWLDEVRPLLNPGKHPALFDHRAAGPHVAAQHQRRVHRGP